MEVKVFFININKFLPFLKKDSVEKFFRRRVFSSDKRQLEFCIGRFLITHVLENYYNIKNPQIVVKNKKPCLESGNVHFSLSHSREIVLCAFSSSPVGADIEYMNDRDFEKLFERYNISENQRTKEGFYEFWTKYEARIKLQAVASKEITMKLCKEYMLAVCSAADSDFEKDLSITELVFDSENNTLNSR